MAVTQCLRIVALAALGLLVAAPPATAHTVLVGTEPQADAVVVDTPAAVALIFSEPVSQELAQVEVRAPGGASIEAGAADIAGERVEQPLGAFPEQGRYTVAFRVVARDGHPLTGEFSFRYEGLVAANPSATPHPTEHPLDAPSHGGEHGEREPDDAAAAPPPDRAARPPSSPPSPQVPAGLVLGASALLLAVAGAATFAVRGLVRWQPPD